MKTVYAELTVDEMKQSGDIETIVKEALQEHGIKVNGLTNNLPEQNKMLQEGVTIKKAGVQVQSDITSTGSGGMVSPD
ncbi:hypothetical protein [Domibacillus epiphyticus]|uniref:Uncharacterized protein n=1 Tax=Domibacillus epiphyticus TaxID=1714355 RepID=A0A1V2A3Z8_9BACI|nr:hypothetical protein [Domibacillus epiphyticus]OMP65735.1 hypothetical protein BTO28_15830 [Domibacillus epiphyticus]